jgi:CheY-like chemotaxis protein
MPSFSRVSNRNFLAGLSPDHFEVLRSAMTERTLVAGELLCEPGDATSRACVVDEGELDVFAHSPGGGVVSLGSASSGELLGDLDLLTEAPTLIGYRARGNVRLLTLDRRDFVGLATWFRPESFGVLRRLLQLECQRVWDGLKAVARSDGLEFPASPRSAPTPLETPIHLASSALARLPLLSGFAEDDVASLVDRVQGEAFEAKRGITLACPGSQAEHGWLVVRGAVETLLGSEVASRRVAVHGPGAVEGLVAVVLDEPQPLEIRVREDAVLCRFPAARLKAVIDDEDRLGFKLVSALSRGAAWQVERLTRTLVRIQRTSAVEPAPALRQSRVLVVDDNPMNRGVLAMHLEEMGHVSEEAEHGGVALERLAASAFDAVLLDVQMPVLDGYGVLESMQRDPRLRGIPVVMITAVDTLESALRCLRSGAVDYLPRTFDPFLLQTRLDGCLQRARVRA